MFEAETLELAKEFNIGSPSVDSDRWTAQLGMSLRSGAVNHGKIWAALQSVIIGLCYTTNRTMVATREHI